MPPKSTQSVDTSPEHNIRLPAKVILAAGTYDGVLAGYEIHLVPGKGVPDNDEEDSSLEGDKNDPNEAKNNKLQIVFASPVHNGSVRSLTTSRSNNHSCLLLSTGYDEMLQTHDFGKGLTSSGQVRTPSDFGTPVCSAFAPPHSTATTASATHCLVGFGSSTTPEAAGGGKLVIYRKRDWSVQHVMNGHEGGIASVAVHPTGKLALTGGNQDGKLKLWDLERGRLAHSSATVKAAATQVEGRKHYEPISCISWSEEGDCYGFCHGSHITIREVTTGKDLLDVDLPCKVNQVCLMRGPEGLFVAAAGNDGSLPVLAVGDVEGDDKSARRAIMAIEPVNGPVAGDERFKCIQTVTGYYVATANSGGVISLMNLQGSINMMTSSGGALEDDDDDDDDSAEEPVDSDSDASSDDENDDDLAVEIVDSILLGSGARITCLAAWAAPLLEELEMPLNVPKIRKERTKDTDDAISSKKKQKRGDNEDSTKNEVVMDNEKLEKARALAQQAKKIQKRKTIKKQKRLQGI